MADVMIRVFFLYIIRRKNEIHSYHGIIPHKLAEREEKMSNKLMKQEIREAITAGERALSSLYAAQEKLSSASTWGALDMFGGGMFISMIKRSKVNDASQYLEEAKRNLLAFQRELRDVQVTMDLRIEIGGFLSFADFFFDGFVADYLVQKKIADAREQISDAILRVDRLLRKLKLQYNQI